MAKAPPSLSYLDRGRRCLLAQRRPAAQYEFRSAGVQLTGAAGQLRGVAAVGDAATYHDHRIRPALMHQLDEGQLALRVSLGAADRQSRPPSAASLAFFPRGGVCRSCFVATAKSMPPWSLGRRAWRRRAVQLLSRRPRQEEDPGQPRPGRPGQPRRPGGEPPKPDEQSGPTASSRARGPRVSQAPQRSRNPAGNPKADRPADGFANYYFNELNRDRVWSAFTAKGDFQSLGGAWKLTGDMAGGGKVEITLGDDA